MNRPVIESQITARSQGNYHLGLQCVVCHKTVDIKLTGAEMYQLQTSDRNIQDVLPNHTAGEREMFVSGICSSCFDDIFRENPPNEEDEDDDTEAE